MQVIELSNHPGDMLTDVVLRQPAEVQRLIRRDHDFPEHRRR